MLHIDWDAELPEEQRDAMIEEMAQQVAKRGLNFPAVLFLELHKPFTFFASQGLLLGSGFLAPLFGPQKLQQYVKLMESRDNIERLIQRIEEMHEEDRAKARGQRPETPEPTHSSS